ncbi:MAG: methyltransferase domain-containing protein [Candidatus Berkelbacteria bacterium]|nr:methyltransferase domain-containing protein [Candidatus Berkelbacteria bacterium]
MKVLFLTQYDETGPSSRVRVYQFLPNFKKAGLKFSVKPLLTKELKIISQNDSPFFLKIRTGAVLIGNFFRRYIDVISALGYDVVVVQKDTLPFLQFSILRLFNRKIIYEFDDAIWQPNPGVKKNRISAWLFSYRKKLLSRILKKSAYVLAENSYLLRYAKQFNKNLEIISAPIDTKKYQPAKKPSKKQIVIGWLGSPTTTYLLLSLKSVLDKIAEKNDVVLHNIGGNEVKFDKIKVENIAWTEKSEVGNLRKFDIGLMPLDNSPFNRGRLGYKMIVYFAMGIPTVASNVGLNKTAIKNGENGFLVKDEKEWILVLKKLIESEKLRKSIGRSGRTAAESIYALDLCAEKYIRLIYNVAEANSRTGEPWQNSILRYHLGKRQKLQEIKRFFAGEKTFPNCLDIGTGTGAIAGKYQKYGDRWSYLEPEKEIIVEAKKVLGTVPKFFTDLRQIKNQKFDLITVVDTFFYFKNPDLEIRRLSKILKPKGKILLTLNDGNRRRLINKIREKISLGKKIRGFQFEESADTVKKRFHQAGFSADYYKTFSNFFTEIILLLIDISQIKINNRGKKSIELTNTKAVNPKQIFLLRFFYPLAVFVSSLDFFLQKIVIGNKFIIVFKK